MKKKAICVLLLMAVCGSMPIISQAANGVECGDPCVILEPGTGENDIPEDARPITVYLIVGANGACVPKDAKYSPSMNRIYIKEGKRIMNYNVYENRHYGQERDSKGAYKYTAGNYYFDL